MSQAEKSLAERVARLIPDPYVLIMALIIVSGIATYVIPAGQYERQTTDGTKTVVPGSYHHIEQQPVSWVELLKSAQKGLIQSAPIIFFILIVGGTLGIINATGALDGLLGYIVQKARETENEYLVLVILPFIFSFLSGVIGFFEETIAFIPLLVVLARELDYDAIVGCSLGLLGVTAGFTAAPLNPFTVGIAQKIAGLPLYSGMWYRWVVWFFATSIAVAYIYYYASKIKSDPSQSLMSDLDSDRFDFGSISTEKELNQRQIAVLLIFFSAFVILIVGVIQFGWYINEIATLFLVIGLIAGIVYGMGGSTLIENFISGAEDLLYAALIVGFARAILVVLREGDIFDTIVHTIIQSLQHLPSVVSAVLMVPAMVVVDFFIPSGSGQAAVVIPILAPVADVLGISRQIVILAFQYGDGFANMFVPTSGATIAMISMAEIPYQRWLVYASKLLIIELLFGMFTIVVAVVINLPSPTW